MAIDESVVRSLKEKFSSVHPLVFKRSVERCLSPGNLFDILSNIPSPPFVWDDASKRWQHTDDISQSKEFDINWN